MKKHILLFFLLIGLSGLKPIVACQAQYTYQVDSTGGIQFTNTSTGIYSNSTWSFGDGTSSAQANPYHQYNSNGWKSICLTIYDSTGSGCQSVFCDSVYIGSIFIPCIANFSYQVIGNIISLSNNSSGNYQGFLWNYGDGSTGTANQHTYALLGVYTVSLTIGTNPASNCGDSIAHIITIGGTPSCNANFTAIDTNGSVLFIPQVTLSNYSYSWAFGDGTSSSQMNAFHTYATGIWTACLTITDSSQNCSATWCDSIFVGSTSACQATISYQQNANGTVYCYGANTGGGVVTNWQWSFGDGTYGTGQYPNHTYTTSGTYNLCLGINTSTCGDSVCTTITVNIPGSGCNANFTSFDSSGIYYFIPAVSAANLNYYWDFGDNTASTQAYPTHQYQGNGPWNVCLTIVDSSQGCSITHCQLVYSSTPVPCQAYFSYSTDSLGNVQFYNASTGNFTNVQWSFGDGTASTLFNATHSYNGTGPYTVCLTVYGNNPSNTCQSTFCDSIYPGLNANSCVPVFYTYPDSSTFGNGNMNFNLMNNCAGTTYVWDFGDSTTATGIVNTHLFPATGWYNVCVTATTPTATYTYCNQVYAYRLSSGIAAVESLNATTFPNPVASIATVQFTAAGETTLDILGLDGRQVYTQYSGLLKGESQIQMDLSTLETGLYFVRIQSGNIRGTVKILVQH